MKYNGNINYVKCMEYGLNLSEGALIDVMLNLSTWAQGKEFDGEIYYYLSVGKLIEELPIISNKENTFRKILKNLKDKGLIDSIIINNRGYYKISELGKGFYKSVEKNPQECGKKSTEGVEKNPHYNNTSNTNTNYNKNNISKDILQKKEKEILIIEEQVSLKEKIKQELTINLFLDDGGQEYLKNEINKFHDYWTESRVKGKGGGVIMIEKWQEEKFFEINKRFRRWLINQKNFNKNNNLSFNKPSIGQQVAI